MKQLQSISLIVLCNILNIHTIQTSQNKLGSTKICFNNAPPTFGTTHFIVGYEGKSNSKKAKKTVVHKKQQFSHTIHGLDKKRITQSFFTTIHDLSPILLEIMSEAETHLYIAAFNLTDMRIVDHVKNAHKNGINVCVITDASNMKQAHNKIQILINADVPVWYYKPSLNPQYKKGLSEPCMHHKLIVGDDFVVTGSANFTKAGQKTNIENITIVRDLQTVDEYHAEFERLKKYCVRCMPQTLE
ncbi:MAG TPA: phospholipase D-like domain-containing protein [Candidatus Babeliales bacterium]|jgi:phosphatidylserine/phosphatidylglycerophosphate/cardiolipin synthase-like enzyme|nr:phospholipase D-like domain-containing protein [Candidatus Babeliales bacterium]